jgi:hypothetical protein
MSEKLSEETKALMGTFAAAEAALAEAAAVWRQFRQPRVDTAAGHKKADAMEREARFRLANAALLWLWHVEERAARAEARPEAAWEARCGQVEMALSQLSRAVLRVIEAKDAFRSPERDSHPNLVLEEAEAWVALRKLLSALPVQPEARPRPHQPPGARR